MKFSDLVNQRLIGYMDLKNNAISLKEQLQSYANFSIVLFLGDNILNCQRVMLVSDNKEHEYHWYTNWRLVELSNDITLEMDSTYKSIGENIRNIRTDCKLENVLDGDNIMAEMDRWIAAVGEGNWNAKENENYFFIWIETGTKTLSLGTVYHDCHYPDTIWEFI